MVGAPERDNDKGAVYIYDLSGDVSSWSDTETLITGVADGQGFGRGVALAGDVLPRGQDGRQIAPGSSFSEVSPATTLPSRCLANARQPGNLPSSLEALSLPRVRS